MPALALLSCVEYATVIFVSVAALRLTVKRTELSVPVALLPSSAEAPVTETAIAPPPNDSICRDSRPCISTT